MAEIVFESNKGIVFERTVYKNNRCKLDVKNKKLGCTLFFYRYKNVPSYQSPYLNWKNLNCCNDWTHDKTYLYTAVQQNKKLFSDIDFTIANVEYAKKYDCYTEKTAGEILSKLKCELPDDCVIGINGKDDKRLYCTYRHIFICKKRNAKGLL